MTSKRTIPGANAAFVPGRIEVLGKHTDYAGGSSLTCAIDRGFHGRFERREDGQFVFWDEDAQARYEPQFPLMDGDGPSDWTRYPWTLMRRFTQDFTGPYHGVNISWTSDLPRAAGLSSSSAFLTLLFLALRECESLQEWERYRQAIDSNTALAAYLAAVESGRAFASFGADAGVGTRGGAGDHTAILCSEPGMLSLFDYDPPRLRRRLAVPPHCIFAVGITGVEACKTGNAAAQYGLATRLAETAASLWRAATGNDAPHLGGMLEVSTGEEIHKVLRSADCPDFTGEELVRRFRHFELEETVHLPAAVAALAAGDLVQFGLVADASQLAAEDLLGNQIAETRFLQRQARDLGAHAASAFGAGFGGAVWALVKLDEAELFLERWSRRYEARYPEHRVASQFLLTAAAGPARLMTTEKDQSWTCPP